MGGREEGKVMREEMRKGDKKCKQTANNNNNNNKAKYTHKQAPKHLANIRWPHRSLDLNGIFQSVLFCCEYALNDGCVSLREGALFYFEILELS